MRKHNRTRKYESAVEEADLIHSTPQYAFVRFKNGHESIISLRDIAPLPENDKFPSNPNENRIVNDEAEEAIFSDDLNTSKDETQINSEHEQQENENCLSPEVVPLRRSSRMRKQPDRLTYYHSN